MPLYAVAHSDQGPAAIALGVSRRCRWSRTHRHVLLPSVPGVRTPWSLKEVARSLINVLLERGAAEVEMQSFGGIGRLLDLGATTDGRERIEHRIDLSGVDAGAIARRFNNSHHRYAKRGERQGWQLRILNGDEAAALIDVIQDGAAARAQLRRDPFKGRWIANSLTSKTNPLSMPWGLACLAAYDGHEPLSAVVVGWANGCAYDLLSGSTPLGYKRYAAFWLQWRIMSYLADAGFSSYNLGGVPAAAEAPDHPAHGLHRFKSGFGSEPVVCRGAHWVLRPEHMRAHDMMQGLKSVTDRIVGLAAGSWSRA
jgi:hypothetical protein